MLLMKKEFFEAIRLGRKTTTLRYWRRRMVAPGSVHNVRGLGRLRIESVQPVEPDSLTDADAQADGLDDVAALTAALATLYTPQQRGERTLYLVRFQFVGSQ